MKFETKNNVYSDKCTFNELKSGYLSYEAAKKKNISNDDDLDFDEADDIDTEALLQQFDDEIDAMDFDEIDLDDFDDDLNDDDLDVFDNDFDSDKAVKKKRKKNDDDDDDDDEIDDSKFYNDEFKDFDNYTTISDFDDDLDSYIQNEDDGYYDYDDRY